MTDRNGVPWHSARGATYSYWTAHVLLEIYKCMQSYITMSLKITRNVINKHKNFLRIKNFYA